MIRTMTMLAALAVAMPAAAQSVTVRTGEEVVFRITGTGIQPVARAKVEPSAFEAAVGAEFDRGDHAEALGANGKPMGDDGTRPAAPVPEAGLVRVRMTATARGSALLIVENGYPQGVAYKARMTKGGQSTPTGVCLVIPGKLAVEHWPYPLESIDDRCRTTAHTRDHRYCLP